MSIRSSATSISPRTVARPTARRRHLVLCLDNTDYEASLELRKFYEALPDIDADAHGQLRVIDESGEDYLYPASRFIKVPLTPTLRRRLLRAI